MVDNSSLGAAKTAKNDEFYTQYCDIEAEMNSYIDYNPDVFRDKTILCPCDDPEWSNFTRYFAANFARLGLKKLICTSYAKGAGNLHTTRFESSSPHYDKSKHDDHGKLFILTRDENSSGGVERKDVEFMGYLEGDGDFRSVEVSALRDEADIVVTNPPFSLFHDFITWLMDGNKEFIAIGNMNAIKYVEVFPRIKRSEIWLGTTYPKYFKIPNNAGIEPDMEIDGDAYQSFGNVCWFTNVDHGMRHKIMMLDTMRHNLKFNKKLAKRLQEKYGTGEYPRFSNYDALEVPYVECIPSDYDGVMGVPISYLDKHNPDQFELLGISGDLFWATTECGFFCPPDEAVQRQCKAKSRTWRVQKVYVDDEDGLPLVPIYDRLFIQHRKGSGE